MRRGTLACACLVSVIFARWPGVASAQAPAHPLDALSASEYWTVFEVLKGSGKVDAKSRYASINLQEPPKAEILNWTKGQPFRREALAVVKQGPATLEAVVDVAARKLLAWRKVEGALANMTRDEFESIGELVKSHADWQAAMKRRSIVDFETVDCFGGVLGYFDTEPERGRRLIKAVCNERRGGWSGQFRPIEGVITLIDQDKGQVVKVIDTGVRPVPHDTSDYDDGVGRPARDVPGPLLMQQPLGPGFRLNGQTVQWQNWSFHFRIDPRVGTVVSLVRYTDGGRERPVLHQGLLSEIFVPYMDPDEGWYFVNFLDLGEGPSGVATPLERGTDCPDHASYFDAIFADERGIPQRRRSAACLFERETGDMAWRHSRGPGEIDSRVRRDLVLRQIATIGNYDYLVDWVFQQDGAIKVVAGATGQVNVKAVSPRTVETTAEASMGSNGDNRSAPERPDAYGRFVASNTVAVNHDHFLSFRLDMDVDGPENSLVIDRLVARQLPAGHPRRSMWVVESSTPRTEEQGKLDAHASEPALWRVVNPGKRGHTGYPVSYQLKPGHSATSLLAADDNPQVRAGFSKHQLWVTRHSDAERLAVGPYPTGARQADGLPVWTKANRAIENTDIVLWYTMGMHHVVRAEDWPVMPVNWHELEIRPFDFFDRNPALDLPRRR
jgi:primary-amine oxidase